MATPASASIAHQAEVAPRDGISFTRLLWVAPLTLVVAPAVNSAIKFIAQQLNPAGFARMPQLQEPMLILTIEGVVAAVLVFIVAALLVPQPIFWYRTIGVCALVLSLLPDIALATGGQPMFMAMRTAGLLTSIGPGGPGGPPPGGGPGGPGGAPGGGAGGPPPGFNFTMPSHQVLLLMLLHVATAVVCIVLLTTLTRRPRRSASAATRAVAAEPVPD